MGKKEKKTCKIQKNRRKKNEKNGKKKTKHKKKIKKTCNKSYNIFPTYITYQKKPSSFTVELSSIFGDKQSLRVSDKKFSRCVIYIYIYNLKIY